MVKKLCLSKKAREVFRAFGRRGGQISHKHNPRGAFLRWSKTGGRPRKLTKENIKLARKLRKKARPKWSYSSIAKLLGVARATLMRALQKGNA